MSGPKRISLLALLALQLSMPKSLLGDVISEKSIGMIAGPRGSGKTFLVLFIAYAIAATKFLKPWGWGTGAEVCYVDAEMRLHTFQDRLKAIKASDTKPNPDERVGPNFQVISRDHSQCPIGPIDTEEGRAQIELLIPKQTKLLVLDNLSALSSEGREDAATWAGVKTWIMRLRDKGMAVLLVHHAGKNGQQRGTSAHEDLLDYSVLLTPLPSSVDREDTRFSIEHTKLRDDILELRKKYAFSFWSESGVLMHDVKVLSTLSPTRARSSDLERVLR